ncbi:MAG TPA: hypothetical protein DDZ92_11100, partial [Halomonas sp.]|nr:hypothetical protein [Halomonas sp.]
MNRVPPNVLLILDNSESGQEGLDGRVAIGNNVGDRESSICRGPSLNATNCPAGAASPLSKSSIMKSVGLQIINDYRHSINLGLMAYQQNPASRNRNNFASGNTVVWRLTERAVDVRYSTQSNPSWYNPDFDGAWDSTTKRYRTRLPNSDFYAFFNVGVPGYFIVDRDSRDLPGTSDDKTEYWRNIQNPTTTSDQLIERYQGLATNRNSGWPVIETNSVWYDDPVITGYTGPWWNRTPVVARATLPIVDSLRQRGIPNWGRHTASIQLNQQEWRTTSSPGRGFLHVPIGGINADGTSAENHWQAIRTKLGTQRHNWTDTRINPMIAPSWPLLSTGLTPIEGTMYTALDYFSGQSIDADENITGRRTAIPLPNANQQCLVNANIWLTDGLPSVDRDGAPLGNNVSKALEDARVAIKNLNEATDVKTYIVGFSLPPDIANLPNVSDDPLGDLARAGGTERAYFANDEASLNQVMQQVLGNIIAASQSNTSAAVNSDEFGLEDGNLLYTAGFRSEDWSGRLAASEIASNGTRSQRWNAETELTSQVGNRQLLTFQRFENGTRSGVVLSAENSGLTSAEVRWLQGETVSGLRPRQSLLGD